MSQKTEEKTSERSQFSADLSVIKRKQQKESFEKKIRVAAYCRVSKDIELQQTSLDTQMASYQKLIQEHPDWELAGIYADQGQTGTNASKRIEFQRMIDDAKSGKVDLILAKSISRFARNTVDALQYTRELKEMGVGVYFEKERINTLSATSEMLLTVYAAFAQEESHSISENMKKGMRQRFKMGIPKWSLLYGLERTGKDEWGIVESEARVIREIFERYILGNSLMEIANHLNERGIPGPSKNGNPWHINPIGEILKNEKYIGDCLMQKTYTVDHLTHRKVQNKDATVEQYYKKNHHPAIVDREIYEIVQTIMVMKDKNRGYLQYPYYGFLKCPYCGEPMVKCRLNTRKTESAWICGGHGEKIFCYERTDCPTYWMKEKYIVSAVHQAMEELEADNYEKKTAEEITWVQKELKRQNRIEYIYLLKLVEKITFPDWNTLEITWKFPGTANISIAYQLPSDYPQPVLEQEGGEWMIGGIPVLKCGVKAARMAIEKQSDCVRNMMIIPPEEGDMVQIPCVRRKGTANEGNKDRT
ncbi:MAG: recombinase family protein [Lachnospiraceae bacterium]|nr:recombinase family protein [Lachnospiraceae bacterium]